MITLGKALPVIRQLAMGFASSPECGTCRCSHIQAVHVDRYGQCTGRHGGGRLCDCSRFQGLNKSKQRLLEQFGAALLGDLRRTNKKARKRKIRLDRAAGP
jgi:hypothetical protein